MNTASLSRMDHVIIHPSQSLVKGGGPAAQFRLSAIRTKLGLMTLAAASVHDRELGFTEGEQYIPLSAPSMPRIIPKRSGGC